MANVISISTKLWFVLVRNMVLVSQSEWFCQNMHLAPPLWMCVFYPNNFLCNFSCVMQIFDIWLEDLIAGRLLFPVESSAVRRWWDQTEAQRQERHTPAVEGHICQRDETVSETLPSDPQRQLLFPPSTSPLIMYSVDILTGMSIMLD